MRLVDADELMTEIMDNDLDHLQRDDWKEVIQIVQDAQTIQPKRMRGKWIYGESVTGIDGYFCNKCGYFVPWDYSQKCFDFIKDYRYCPSCGVKMDGGEQDEQT